MLCRIKNRIVDFGEQKLQERGVAAALGNGNKCQGTSGEGVLFTSKECWVACEGGMKEEQFEQPRGLN